MWLQPPLTRCPCITGVTVLITQMGHLSPKGTRPPKAFTPLLGLHLSQFLPLYSSWSYSRDLLLCTWLLGSIPSLALLGSGLAPHGLQTLALSQCFSGTKSTSVPAGPWASVSTLPGHCLHPVPGTNPSGPQSGPSP